MALIAEKMPPTGQPFPPLRFDLLKGKEVLRVLFPGNSGGKWAIFLFYCGSSSCPRCRQQLVRLEQLLRTNKRGYLRVVAASSGSREQAIESAWNLQVSFPIAYAVNRETIDILDGKKRPDSCPKVFLIDPGGRLSGYFRGDAQFPTDWLRSIDEYKGPALLI